MIKCKLCGKPIMLGIYGLDKDINEWKHLKIEHSITFKKDENLELNDLFMKYFNEN